VDHLDVSPRPIEPEAYDPPVAWGLEALKEMPNSLIDDDRIRSHPSRRDLRFVE